MPLPAVLVTVTAAERKALKKRIRGTRTAWRDRRRAQIVLAAALRTAQRHHPPRG
jgi:hypothetical protein